MLNKMEHYFQTEDLFMDLFMELQNYYPMPKSPIRLVLGQMLLAHRVFKPGRLIT